jgi:hypothetical protein
MKEFKTKSATKNAIYKIVTPLTRGFFNDTSWENVRKIWEALEAECVFLSVDRAIYGAPDICKTWYFTAEVNGFVFKGYLVASFCGTKEDPTGRYDLCFVIS